MPVYSKIIPDYPYFCHVKEFILEHENDDPSRLILSKNTVWPQLENGLGRDAVIYTLEGRKKMKTKVPQWYGIPDLIYPTRICTEQCSSAATAAYKASLLPKGGSVADLTSGLGVDVAAFSAVSSKVLYNDMNPELVAAAKHNFQRLGLDNIVFSNTEVTPLTIEGLLSEGWDTVFIDPARRDSSGRKVFLLEDCSPDVLTILPEVFKKTARVILKLSPMADISMLAERLDSTKEIHIVASGGECKELLVLLEKGYNGDFSLILNEDGTIIRPEPGAERNSRAEIAKTIEQGQILFEPGKSITKAGLFNWVSQFYGIKKAGVNTHIYFGTEPIPTGRNYVIEKILPLDKKSLKAAGKEYPDADVTARNIPLSSDSLRAKMGIKTSNNTGRHIFGIHSDGLGGNFLLICRRA